MYSGCLRCDFHRNCINGLYCVKLKVYVEYARKKECEIKIEKLMKTKDFEVAIAALNVGIVIDEMKLRHADVRRVIGHHGNRGIVWDEYGRGFTASSEREVYLAPNEEGRWQEVEVYAVARNKLYDLTFD